MLFPVALFRCNFGSGVPIWLSDFTLLPLVEEMDVVLSSIETFSGLQNLNEYFPENFR